MAASQARSLAGRPGLPPSATRRECFGPHPGSPPGRPASPGPPPPLEHACGGVCACSTCHVHVEEGMEHLSEETDAEMDRVEEAPGLSRNSRLSCQCEIKGPGPIVVRVPA
ncbi:MAG TPA: 2Fe-2S iron-sulfur cluster-binding protein, partial [Phycisphaerae bacterium]|nr:2Fe-2S iron-sulfur cluster-binding protein [Phycisphaerae bacterium]